MVATQRKSVEGVRESFRGGRERPPQRILGPDALLLERAEGQHQRDERNRTLSNPEGCDVEAVSEQGKVLAK